MNNKCLNQHQLLIIIILKYKFYIKMNNNNNEDRNMFENIQYPCKNCTIIIIVTETQ